ncbi:tumor necrosis factor receptor superfamily member 19 [Clupea harengus]|uniref:Tumor necrosis factor receptor superfamily member 19 n=1 Tax=Clupea harengus TaxID=7950 RepID=A0A6P8FT89_CLUHA|nr:tumor necrosis factor receptor superfamily member 19 [Clupea harengus]XP_031429794.1 tumor necrosis factor receptor superfamily member 19 [Clupea harengus]
MAASLDAHTWLPLLKLLLLLLPSMVPVLAEETRECREQEYKDRFGNCMPCKQCDAGEELSKECGFGYGEDAQCVPCRANRFKEDRGLQKCKICLDCALINRFQTGNCSATSNAVCGDCLPGFYRKTKLSGFLDMECIQCGDPPPPYEPHCSGRVNLVPIPSTVTSPRDMALAAVICSALATVLLALLVLCVIYCKRQLLEKKPSGSLRSQEVPYCEAELACLNRRRAVELAQRPCCHCHHGHHGPGHTCGPVPLISSLCCEDTCSLGRSGDSSPFQSRESLNDGHANQSAGSSLTDLEGRPEVWPLAQGLHCESRKRNTASAEEERLEGQREEEEEEVEEEEEERRGRLNLQEQEQREGGGAADCSSLSQQ